MPRDEHGLTPRQRKFADEYIKCGNASEAARRAGYTARADVAGAQNLAKPVIKQYIAQRMQPDDEKRIADADEVLQYLSDVMRGKVKDQFGLDASLQDRTKAAQELMKRYAVADMRQASTMARLDSLFVEFRAALDAPVQPPEPAPGDAATSPGDAAGDSAPGQADAPETSAPDAGANASTTA